MCKDFSFAAAIAVLVDPSLGKDLNFIQTITLIKKHVMDTFMVPMVDFSYSAKQQVRKFLEKYFHSFQVGLALKYIKTL